MIAKYASLFCILLFSQLKVLSQEVQFIDAVLDEPNNTIEIIFDLQTNSADDFYEVSLFYSNDGGKTFVGPVERVSGEVGKQISRGSNKRIYWNYFYENEDFTGQNLVFSVRARKMTIPNAGKLYMGPKAALYSVLVPGLGDYKVRDGKGYWLITTGTWGLLGASLIARSGANNDYSAYLNAQDINTANTAFDQAESKFSTFRTLQTIAIAAWIADVVGVYIKGNKNRRQGLTSKDYHINWNLTMRPDGGSAMAGISVKF